MTLFIERLALERLKKLMTPEQKIVIVSHINPDGDAIGSVTALDSYLRKLGAAPTILLPNSPPHYLSFLNRSDSIYTFERDREKVIELIGEATLIVALDFNSFSRAGEMEQYLLDAKGVKVLIDHHPHPEREQFELLFSDTTASSTCELLFAILEKMGRGFSHDVAESLYVGMMTDTNNFSNSVTNYTFEMASKLLALGVDKEKLQHKVTGQYSEGRMRLMGHLLLNKMVILDRYGVAYMVLSLEEKEQFGYQIGDAEGFVNIPLDIAGISISVLFAERDDEIRVSLRSNNNFSVNKLARLHFEGGGHERAAGGSVEGPIESVGEKLERALADSYNLCFIEE